jgi:hypothetical protein
MNNQYHSTNQELGDSKESKRLDLRRRSYVGAGHMSGSILVSELRGETFSTDEAVDKFAFTLRRSPIRSKKISGCVAKEERRLKGSEKVAVTYEKSRRKTA